MQVGETLFTGQVIKEGTLFFQVTCPVCGKDVTLRTAWIDPYYSPGKEVYVYYACLSEKRLKDIDDFNKE